MTFLQMTQMQLQGLGKSLMLPIAVLPVAGLMLRLAQPDLLGLPFVAAAGQAVFGHLGLLFAIGVAIGIARENNGAAGLAGAVAFVVLTEGAKALIQMPVDALPPRHLDRAVTESLIGLWKDRELAKLSVPAGILCGLAAGSLYNRYHEIRFPEYLSFFGGRRFVPIISGVFGLFGAVLFGLGFPLLEAGIDRLSSGVAQSGSFGLFLYGMLNRILIVTGLHHILNNIVWFVLGDYQGATGDLNRFFAGDPTAGAFMTGYFPVMMFGLPAACLAMWRAARPERRAAVGGMLMSMALTSFLTGVTEPIEFTFMFLAPALFALHAVLTGLSMVIMDLLDARIGFGFSAGLFDYLLNFRSSTRPLMLIPVGSAYAAIYYATFSYVIHRFDLPTPGREPIVEDERPSVVHAVPTAVAPGFVRALGGSDNIVEIDACMTRLRLSLVDRTLVCEQQLKALGAKGSITIGERGLQVVIGPESDNIANAMRALVKIGSPLPAPTVAMSDDGVSNLCIALSGFLGGVDNIAEAFRTGARTVIRVCDPSRVDQLQLDLAFPDRVFRSRAGVFHILDAE
jgi:N-acetylglucosamine PTS system EIICBA or EIICB component